MIDSQDKRKQDFPASSNSTNPQALQPDTSRPTSQVQPECCHSDTPSNKGGNSVTVSQTQDGHSSVDLAQGPLILNLGNLTNGGVMLMTGQASNTMQLSIVTNTTNSGQLPSWSQNQSSVCTSSTTHNNTEQNLTAGHVYRSQPCCHCANFSAVQTNQASSNQNNEQSQNQGHSYRINKDKPSFVTMTTISQNSVHSQNSQNYTPSHIHSCHLIQNKNTGQTIPPVMTMNSDPLNQQHCCHGNLDTFEMTMNKGLIGQIETRVDTNSVQQTNSTDGIQQLVESVTDIYPGPPPVQTGETLSSLVDELNLELMATDTMKESLDGGTNSKSSFGHLGDSFDSLRASLNSLPGSDLNLEQLDLLDMPELDKIYHDISNNSNMNSQNPQGSANGQNQINGTVIMSNILGQNENVLSGEIAQIQHSLCSHNSTDCDSVTLNNTSVAINSNSSSSHQNSLNSYSHELTVAPPSQPYNSGVDNLSQSLKANSSVAVITDFSPDWTYTEVCMKL